MPWRVVVNNMTPERIERVIDFEGDPAPSPAYRFIAQRQPDGGFQLNFAMRDSPYGEWRTAPMVPIVILDHIYGIMNDARLMWLTGGGGRAPVPPGPFEEGSVFELENV